MEGYLDSTDTLDSRQFLIAVKKLADTLSYGTDRSPFLGSGIEFVQSRPYQWGDPIRSIDWRVTARTGKLYVKEYEAPKRLPCHLLVDTSASMAVTSVPKSKYAVAVHIAGGVAFACLERVSPVGVVGVGGREFRIEPSLSAGQVLQWLHKLRRFRYDEPTAVGRRIAELASTLTSRALVIALTDLHDPSAVPALKLLAQKHDCVVLQLQDPAEAGLRGGGVPPGRRGRDRPGVRHPRPAAVARPGGHRPGAQAGPGGSFHRPHRPAVREQAAQLLQSAQPARKGGALVVCCS